jgi:hypothetical protein
MRSTRPKTLISYIAHLKVPPGSSEELCGQPRQQKWGIGGKLGMEKESSFGKIIGWVLQA